MEKNKIETGFSSDAKKEPRRVVFVTKKTSAKVVGDPGPQLMTYPHQLRAGIAYYLRRGFLRDKNHAARLFLRVRAEARFDFILFHRRPWALRSDRHPFAHARNEFR